MLDAIYGQVTSVIDGDTFDMHVERIGNHNEFQYNNNERIRIFGIDAAELGTVDGKRAHLSLINQIGNRSVKCDVRSRDTFGRLIADFNIL